MTMPQASVLAAIAGASNAKTAAFTLPLGRLIDLNTDALLQLGARNADAAFASLCAGLMAARERDAAAERAYDQADQAAAAEAPFPPALTWTETTPPDDEGQPQTFERRWQPSGGPECRRDLQRLAQAEAMRRGVAYRHSLEGELRGQYDAWRVRRDAAEARHSMADLEAEAGAASEAACAAFWRIAEYPAQNIEALLIKLHLRRDRLQNDSDQGPWIETAADLERVLLLTGCADSG